MKRIGESFKGILGGFVFVLIGIILLWWNEGNNVKNLKTTAEMDKNVVDVSSDKVNPSNEGKLIATSGKLINEEELTDSTFNVKVTTPIMKRIVEVYQWEEESETDEDNVTTYTYKKTWSDELIDSSDFHESGHNNPKQKPYKNESFTSSNVKVGAFTLSSNQVEMLSTNANYNNFDEATASKSKLKTSNNYLTTSEDLNSPQIGDVRVSFVYNNSTEISVLAVQQGNTFVNFVSKAGKSVNRVMDGTHSGAEMINVIKSEDKFIKWLLRIVGTLLIIGGIAAILKPISAITSFVPILGSIVGTAVGLVSLIVGLAISLVIIAIAWIRFRPLLGIALLAIVAALVAFLIIRGKKSKDNSAVVQQPTEQSAQPQQNEEQNNNPIDTNNQ